MDNLTKSAAFCCDIKRKAEDYDHCYKMITDLEHVLLPQKDNQLKKWTYFDIANSHTCFVLLQISIVFTFWYCVIIFGVTLTFFWVVELLTRLYLSFKTVILGLGSYHIFGKPRSNLFTNQWSFYWKTWKYGNEFNTFLTLYENKVQEPANSGEAVNSVPEYFGNFSVFS